MLGTEEVSGGSPMSVTRGGWAHSPACQDEAQIDAIHESVTVDVTFALTRFLDSKLVHARSDVVFVENSIPVEVAEGY